MSMSNFMFGRFARSALLALVSSFAGAGSTYAQPASSAPTASAAQPVTETARVTPPVRRHLRRHRRLASRSAPAIVPPAPQQQAAGAMMPAPVPNEGAVAPPDRASQRANVGPSVFQLHYPPQGDGYVTGSSPQAMDDRNASKATGVEMKIPLQQTPAAPTPTN